MFEEIREDIIKRSGIEIGPGPYNKQYIPRTRNLKRFLDF